MFKIVNAITSFIKKDYVITIAQDNLFAAALNHITADMGAWLAAGQLEHSLAA